MEQTPKSHSSLLTFSLIILYVLFVLNLFGLGLGSV